MKHNNGRSVPGTPERAMAILAAALLAIPVAVVFALVLAAVWG